MTAPKTCGECRRQEGKAMTNKPPCPACVRKAVRIEKLEKQLILIGERAVVDWDDETVGLVDAAVGYDGQRYRDWLNHVLHDVPEENKRLKKKLAESKPTPTHDK
jgi:hypothetical protein